MIIGQLVTGFIEHKEFIFFNTLIHIFVGIFIATAIYPFLSKKFKESYNYFMAVFLPSVFGSFFPDFIFIVSVLAKQRSLTDLFDALSHGGTVYTAFQYNLPFLLVIPSTVTLILLLNRVFRKKFDDLPRWSFVLICLFSLIGACAHLFMDSIGF